MQTPSLIILLCTFTIIGARSVKPVKLTPNSSRAIIQWEEYKAKYDKHYDITEDLQRMEVFLERIYQIEIHNQKHDMGLSTFRMGLNQRSDWLPHEREHYLGNAKMFPTSVPSKHEDQTGERLSSAPMNVQVPESIDWRELGFVTSIKNQKNCGSCWAFSAIGAIEAQHKRKTGKLFSLSEQNLMDCAREDYGNLGCYGGLPEHAFEYVVANHGVDTEDSYPYMAVDEEECKFNTSSIGATILGYSRLAKGNETALKIALATAGPVSVSFDAHHDSFYDYRQGVYYEKECRSTRLDHAMLLIGYGVDEELGIKYWLIKNSWGESWGERGYMRVARDHQNHCGIATDAVVPRA